MNNTIIQTIEPIQNNIKQKPESTKDNTNVPALKTTTTP
jgi:hypothetical protein